MKIKSFCRVWWYMVGYHNEDMIDSLGKELSTDDVKAVLLADLDRLDSLKSWSAYESSQYSAAKELLAKLQ